MAKRLTMPTLRIRTQIILPFLLLMLILGIIGTYLTTSLVATSLERRIADQLVHAEDAADTVTEAARVLRPGGRLLILDLREHDQAWVRKRFGDRHLGFSSEQLDALLRGAGLREVKVNVGASKAGDPFAVLIASGTKA